MENTSSATVEVKRAKTQRAYNGPRKGSEEAKKQMEKVRAAQWAKNGLQQMNKR